MQFFRIGLVLVFSLAANGVIAQDVTAADEALNNIIADYWDAYLAADPIAATSVGVNDFNDVLPSVTERAQTRQLQANRGLLSRARDLNLDALTDKGRVNAELLTWVLEDSVGASELGLSRIPFNTFTGFFMRALTASSGVSMERAQDYEDYITRMSEVPRYFAENIENMRTGASDGFVLSQIVVDGVLPTIEAQVKEAAEDSSFFEPFEKMSMRLSPDEQERLRGEARSVIEADVIPAFAKLAEFLSDEYQASQTLGAEQLPNGEAYYAFQIRRYTTLTDTSADEIHATGLA
jgi:uncharacterized protein (DUF885 family)